MVSIEGLDKAAVLAALYNASAPLGMGFLQYKPEPMTVDAANAVLNEYGSPALFDYLHGRLMKIDIPSLADGDKIDPGLYDRDMGEGQAERVIDILRQTGDPCCDEILAIHEAKTGKSAAETKSMLHEPTTTSRANGVVNVSLGLSDVAGPLGDAIDKKVG